jgi:hypothetical protein
MPTGRYPCPRDHFDHTGHRWFEQRDMGRPSSILRSMKSIPLGTNSWEPKHLMYTNTFWVLPPGVARQGFTAAIMAWVEPPWDSAHLFLVPRIQHRSFGRVNKHVDFSGQFKEIPWGKAHSPLVPFVSYYLPPFVRSLKPNIDYGMDPSSKI